MVSEGSVHMVRLLGTYIFACITSGSIYKMVEVNKKDGSKLEEKYSREPIYKGMRPMSLFILLGPRLVDLNVLFPFAA